MGWGLKWPNRSHHSLDYQSTSFTCIIIVIKPNHRCEARVCVSQRGQCQWGNELRSGRHSTLLSPACVSAQHSERSHSITCYIISICYMYKPMSVLSIFECVFYLYRLLFYFVEKVIWTEIWMVLTEWQSKWSWADVSKPNLCQRPTYPDFHTRQNHIILTFSCILVSMAASLSTHGGPLWVVISPSAKESGFPNWGSPLQLSPATRCPVYARAVQIKFLLTYEWLSGVKQVKWARSNCQF